MTSVHSIVGIDLNKVSQSLAIRALKQSGNNFGNLLFTAAVKKQIPNSEIIGFNFSPEKVNDNYSAIVIPAANWINLKTDWGALAENLERANVAVTAVGLGSQLKSLEETKLVSKGTVKFLNVLSAHSKFIGVRGDFTAAVLEKFGITNCKVLGCPSIFYNLNLPSYRPTWNIHLESMAIGATRYELGKQHIAAQTKQRQLYQFALKNADRLIYQSEEVEIKILSGISTIQERKLGAQYYGVHSASEFTGLINKKGRYFQEIDKWISDLSKFDCFVGSRIHGAVAAILAGTPTLLLYHDNRTKELAQAMGIPSYPLEQLEIRKLREKGFLGAQMTSEKLKIRSRENYLNLIDFYEANNVEHSLGALNLIEKR